MPQHIFQSSSELQNIPEAAPSSPSFSVLERLAQYGASGLSAIEHLSLLVGRDSMAEALLRHFGSLKELQRASFRELRQFLTTRQAEAVMAGLSLSSVVDAEDALSTPLNTPEAVYQANSEMRWLRQEVVRVVLLDAQNRCITKVDVSTGTVDEVIAYPCEIFRPVIVHAAAGFVLVHNHPCGDPSPSHRLILGSPNALSKVRGF